MFLRFLLLLTVVPITELIVLLRVHEWASNSWGAGNAFIFTVGSIILTGIVGANLARQQGLSVLAKINENMTRGEMPAANLIEGLMIFVGGALLLTPGYVTDAFGFTLMLPLTRSWYRERVVEWFKAKVSSGDIAFDFNSPPSKNSKNDDDIIDITPIEDNETHR